MLARSITFCATVTVMLWATAAAANSPCVAASNGVAPQRLYGTVTELAPLCVNGFILETPAETRIMRDGRRSTRDALGLGHLVRVETNEAFPLVAERVDIEIVIAGPIEGSDALSRNVKVLRSEVHIRKDALIRGVDGNNQSFSELARGDHIDVSGHRNADGTIEASRIDVRPAGSANHVTGIAVPVGRDTLYVERVRGQTANRMGFDPELRGQRVQLRGKWNARRQQLDEAFVRSRPLTSHATRTLSIEGIAIAGDSAGTLGLTGTPLEVANDTDEGVTLKNGSTIHLLATKDGEGEWLAKRFSVTEASDSGNEITLPPVPPREEEP